MEPSDTPEAVRVIGKRATTVGKRQIGGLVASKVGGGDCFVDQRPQALGRLQYGGVEGQELQGNVFRDRHLARTVAARPVEHQQGEHQQGALVRSLSDIAGKSDENQVEQRGAGTVGQEPHHRSGVRVHEALGAHPPEAVMPVCHGTAAARHPDPAPHWLQADAALVHRPNLQRPSGDLLPGCLHAAAKAGFEEFLGQPVDIGMARYLAGETEATQCFGTAARRNQTSKPAGDPQGNRAARPEAVIVQWSIQAIPRVALLGCVKQRSGAGIELARVVQPRNSSLVVAPHWNAAPARRISRHLGDELGRAPAVQQPNDLKACPLGCTRRVGVQPMQIVGLKVPFQVNCAAYPQTGGAAPP